MRELLTPKGGREYWRDSQNLKEYQFYYGQPYNFCFYGWLVRQNIYISYAGSLQG